MASNAASMTIRETARVFSGLSGVEITEADIQSHIDDGAPIVEDGKINIIIYAAWLTKRIVDFRRRRKT